MECIEDTARKIEKKPSVSSYANRLHGHLARRCYSGQNDYAFISDKEGYKFRGIDYLLGIGSYSPRSLNADNIKRFVSVGPQDTQRDKRAKLKALLRIAIMYGVEDKKTNSAVQAVQSLDFSIGCLNKDYKSVKNRSGVYALREAVIEHKERTGNLPTYRELQDFCEQYLLASRGNDPDPTLKFRRKSQKDTIDRQCDYGRE